MCGPQERHLPGEESKCGAELSPFQEAQVGGREAAWLTPLPHSMSGDPLFSEPEMLNLDPPDLAQMVVAPRGGCGHERQPWAVGVMVFVAASSGEFSYPLLL